MSQASVVMETMEKSLEFTRFTSVLSSAYLGKQEWAVGI